MTDDPRLVTLLRSAMPPIGTPTPSRDLWPRIVKRRQGPVWSRSWLDLALAAGVAAALLMRPDWLSLLVYHF